MKKIAKGTLKALVIVAIVFLIIALDTLTIYGLVQGIRYVGTLVRETIEYAFDSIGISDNPEKTIIEETETKLSNDEVIKQENQKLDEIREHQKKVEE